jgi:biopolymer transport protein ExbD
MRLSRTPAAEIPRFEAAPAVAVMLLVALFFVLSLNASQRELDRLSAAGDGAASDAGVSRLVLELAADGSVLTGARVLHDPARDDGYGALRAFLAEVAPPDELAKRLLLRADPRASFEHVQRLIDRAELDAWQIEFATGGDAASAAGAR